MSKIIYLPDDTLTFPNIVIPGAGTKIFCLENGSKKKATIMGKPSSIMCDHIFKELVKDSSKKFLMIGDTLNADIIFGKRCNFSTLLVESGVNKISDVQKIIDALEEGAVDQDLENQIPDYYIKELGDLLEYMQ